MTTRRIFCIFTFSLIVLNGCNVNRDAEASNNNHTFEGNISEDNSVPSEEYFSGNSFEKLQDEKESILVYENEEFDIKFNHLVNSPGNYVVTCGEQCQEFEIGYVPEDIKELTVTPWDDNSIFLVCNLQLSNGHYQYLILNKEILSEVMVHDPKETVEDRLDWTVAEKGETLWLYVNQVSANVSAGSREALEVLGHNIRPLDEISFHSDNDSFVCDVPLVIFEKNNIGAMRLYYEYDGVGMNCVNMEFVPLS